MKKNTEKKIQKIRFSECLHYIVTFCSYNYHEAIMVKHHYDYPSVSNTIIKTIIDSSIMIKKNNEVHRI